MCEHLKCQSFSVANLISSAISCVQEKSQGLSICSIEDANVIKPSFCAPIVLHCFVRREAAFTRICKWSASALFVQTICLVVQICGGTQAEAEDIRKRARQAMDVFLHSSPTSKTSSSSTTDPFACLSFACVSY